MIVNHKIEHEGVTYNFSLLTLGQEDEWKNWVRDSAIKEALDSSEGWPIDLRAKVLAEVSKSTPLDKCSFLGDIGQTKLASEDGVLKILEMASPKNPPLVPRETIKKLFEAKPNECGEAMLKVLPISEKVRDVMLSEYEKKTAIGLKAGLS